jgi:DNA recombination protein RmuC
MNIVVITMICLCVICNIITIILIVKSPLKVEDKKEDFMQNAQMIQWMQDTTTTLDEIYKIRDNLIAVKSNALQKSDIIENSKSVEKEIYTTITTSLNDLNEKILKEQTDNITQLSNLEREINNSLNERVKGLNETLNKQIDLLNKNVQQSLSDGFKSTSEAYEDLIAKLTTIDNASENIEALSNEVVGLRSVLENNQSRGKFGEFTLERILFSVFGDAKEGVYALQYCMKDGQDLNDRPDSVIFLPKPANLLCIDSKFPFSEYQALVETNDENIKKSFAKAIKKHVDDIARKYIINGKTAPYALMFIPSDAIFGYINGMMYETVEYARSKNVVFSSPSTLQPILASINAIKIEYKRNENYTVMMKALDGLGKDFKKFTEGWLKVDKNIDSTNKSVKEFTTKVESISERFDKINSGAVQIADTKEIDN